jgi:ribosome biogenesis GTPase / thiamine phosphate phosphatase
MRQLQDSFDPATSPRLVALGWSEAWAKTFETATAAEEPGPEPGRVLAGIRDQLRVGTVRGEEEALVPGRLLYRAQSPVDLPCAGDWLALRRLGDDAPLVVEELLPRRSAFVRRAAGRRSEPQALAANVDLAFLVAALDEDWNPRRLERWIGLARDAGVPPVVVLTKLDLCVDPTPAIDAACAVASASWGGSVEVHAVDGRGGAGVGALAAHLTPASTVVLLGSSGVGKSTLANRLAGREVLVTSAVAVDGRGRHTTTRRELIALPGGALLLDTPGLREVGLWLGEEGLESLFPEIEALARGCRFRDCTHESEPGCAVRAAVEAGELDAGRLDSLQKLGAERAALEMRTDEQAARREKQRVRALHRAANKHQPRKL